MRRLVGGEAAEEVPRGGPVMVLHNEGGGVWGHVLVQNFPRALLFLRAFPHGRIGVPAAQMDPARSHRQLFALYGVAEDRLLALPDRPVRLPEAVLVDFAWNFRHDAVHPVVLDLLASVPVPPAAPGGARAIFVARSPRFRRAIANWPEIERVLGERRVAVRFLGEMPVAEQIAAWRTGLPMIAVQGSDLANIVFGRPGQKVLSLKPAWFSDTFFFNLAMARGLVWHELHCGEMARIDPQVSLSDFRVDPGLFGRMLDDMGI